eukprot:SAG31_NODE_32222_length_358_cov_1.138996_1_plen_51_part_10
MLLICTLPLKSAGPHGWSSQTDRSALLFGSAAQLDSNTVDRDDTAESSPST